MNQNFDTLFDQISSGGKQEKLKSTFDELYSQVEKPKKPEKSTLEKGARLAGQFALGALEGSPVGMAYDISTLPLASKEAQNMAYRETLSEDLERLQEQKFSGQWDEADQRRYDNIVEQIKDPRKSMEFAQTGDVSIRGLAEKATGQNLHPEGVLEKSTNWLGFIYKNPQNLLALGLKPLQLLKSIMPKGKEITRGLAAGTALEMAEQGELGPIGTIGAAIVGDLSGLGLAGAVKAASQPKKTAAQFLNLVTRSNSKKEITKQLAEDFKKSGLQIDAGTLTQSPLIQMTQARLAQSGLTGSALDNFRKDLSSQITREYENTIKDLGEITFENNYQASEAIKDALRVEEINLGLPKNQHVPGRSLEGRISIQENAPYERQLLEKISPSEFQSDAQAGINLREEAQNIKAPIKDEFENRWKQLNQEIAHIEAGPQAELAHEIGNFIDEHRGSLLLGESAPEARVLRAAENLRDALRNENGGLIGVTIEDLIKTKRTLGDVANWEFGGSNFESAYKKLVGDVNSAIDRTLQQVNPQLRQEFQQLNSDYSAFKEMFENKNVISLFEPKNKNYNSIHHQFVTNPDKLRSLENILNISPQGEQLINQVKRDYAQRIIGNPKSTPREIRNLSNVLGPQFEQDLNKFIGQKEHALKHPLPKIAKQAPLGITTPIAATTGGKPLIGKVKETGVIRANEAVRKKLYESISKKNPEQIIKQMDTIEGIRKLRRVLSLTPEGKELFKELSRFKMAEMIDNKMKDGLKENIKLGTFSNLLKSTKNKAIAKELLGNQNYNKLILLQKNSGQLAKSAEKFFNASKSGTTLLDMGLIGAAATGVLTGNPFIAVPAMLKIGGSYIIASLFSDPIFIKELEKAILTNNPKQFQKYLKNMRPQVKKAMEELRHFNIHAPQNEQEQEEA